jgi:hypothetical protein
MTQIPFASLARWSGLLTSSPLAAAPQEEFTEITRMRPRNILFPLALQEIRCDLGGRQSDI